MNYIKITWAKGKPAHGAHHDAERARIAAEAVLDAADVDYLDAFEANCGGWLCRLSDLWDEAENAANKALTEGWMYPEGGACYILPDEQ